MLLIQILHTWFNPPPPSPPWPTIITLHSDPSSLTCKAHSVTQELHHQLTFSAPEPCNDHAASVSFLLMFAVVVTVAIIIVHLLFPHPGLVRMESQGLSITRHFVFNSLEQIRTYHLQHTNIFYFFTLKRIKRLSVKIQCKFVIGLPL